MFAPLCKCKCKPQCVNAHGTTHKSFLAFIDGLYCLIFLSCLRPANSFPKGHSSEHKLPWREERKVGINSSTNQVGFWKNKVVARVSWLAKYFLAHLLTLDHIHSGKWAVNWSIVKKNEKGRQGGKGSCLPKCLRQNTDMATLYWDQYIIKSKITANVLPSYPIAQDGSFLPSHEIIISPNIKPRFSLLHHPRKRTRWCCTFSHGSRGEAMVSAEHSD